MFNFKALISFKNKKMDFSFETHSNRIVLFGKSGSGKSTILKIIAGFFKVESGFIKLNDKIILSTEESIYIPTNKRNFGYLPQEYTLFPNLNVMDNILYGVKVKNLNKSKQEIDYIINKLEISDLLDKTPSKLSGGERQRVALARILLINPELLLLDEPFSALDISIRNNLRDMVIEITEELKIPAIFVTHDLEDAYIFGDEIIVVDNGKILEFGTKKSIYNSPKYYETATLIDFKNIWTKKEASTFMPLNKFENKEFEFIAIRPENIMILRNDRPVKSALTDTNLEVKVEKIYQRGRYVQILTKNLNNTYFVINLPEHAFLKQEIELNSNIKISLKTESIILLNNKENLYA